MTSKRCLIDTVHHYLVVRDFFHDIIKYKVHKVFSGQFILWLEENNASTEAG